MKQSVALANGQVFIPYDKFPSLLTAHLKNVENTASIEKEAIRIKNDNFSKWDETDKFIKMVCVWGGYPGISARVIKKNTKSKIQTTLNEIVKELDERPPNIRNAIEKMSSIEQIGISFGSKHLRFLFPNLCPVLDSELSKRFFYKLSIEGYQDFTTKCQDSAKQLNNAGISNPFPERTKNWYPCDIEAALFAYVQKWG